MANRSSHKIDFLKDIKEVILKRYHEKVGDYREIDKKNIQIIILNSALISLFIQFISIKQNYFSIILYMLIFLLLFIPLLILVGHIMPMRTEHINPLAILKKYDLKDPLCQERFTKEISTEYGISFDNLNNIITKRAKALRFSLFLLSIGLMLLFVYNIYFKITG